MATFRGVSAVGTGVLRVLDDAWIRTPFEPAALETLLLRPDDLVTRPTEFGVSVLVYRVAVNGTQRTLPPSTPNRRRPLPVEVDFLLTPWATSSQRQLELLGWCLRVLDDRPILTAAELNVAVPGVFLPTETVEVVPIPLPSDDHVRLWDALPGDFQLSVSYAARLVRLESDVVEQTWPPVLERELDHGVLVP